MRACGALGHSVTDTSTSDSTTPAFAFIVQSAVNASTCSRGYQVYGAVSGIPTIIISSAARNPLERMKAMKAASPRRLPCTPCTSSHVNAPVSRLALVDPFAERPDDLRDLIIEHLPSVQLPQMMLTCKRWHRAIRHAWPALCEARYPTREPYLMPAQCLWPLATRTAVDDEVIRGFLTTLSALCCEYPDALSTRCDVDGVNNRLCAMLAREPRMPADAAIFYLLGGSLEASSPVGTTSGDFGPDEGRLYHDETPREPWRVTLCWSPLGRGPFDDDEGEDEGFGGSGGQEAEQLDLQSLKDIATYWGIGEQVRAASDVPPPCLLLASCLPSAPSYGYRALWHRRGGSTRQAYLAQFLVWVVFTPVTCLAAGGGGQRSARRALPAWRAFVAGASATQQCCAPSCRVRPPSPRPLSTPQTIKHLSLSIPFVTLHFVTLVCTFRHTGSEHDNGPAGRNVQHAILEHPGRRHVDGSVE